MEEMMEKAGEVAMASGALSCLYGICMGHTICYMAGVCREMTFCFDWNCKNGNEGC